MNDMISKYPRYGINNTFTFDNRMFLGRGEQMAPFSFELVFTLLSDTGTTVILSTTKYNNFSLCYNIDGHYFYTTARTPGAGIILPCTVKTGEVCHIVYVCDEEGSHLYVNGILAAENKNVSYIWNNAGDDGNLYTGYINQNEPWYYTANIYSFRTFNYPMVANNARILYNEGRPFLNTLKAQVNPYGILTDATVDKINVWQGDSTKNSDGSVTCTNGNIGSYMGCAIRGSEGNTNGLKAENLTAYRITMTYTSNKPIQVRDLGNTRINQAFFSATNEGEKKTEMHVIQFENKGNTGTPLNFYIYINPYAEGDEFTIYDFKAEQAGILSETLGKNMTTNMVRDTANVVEIAGTKQVIPAQHLIGLSASDKNAEILFNGPIPEIRHNIAEGTGTVEKQPDGGWLVNITAPAPDSPGSRPIIRLCFAPAIDIQPHDTIRVTIQAEPTTDAADRKQISQVFFVAGTQTVKMPFYTDSTEISGQHYNDSARSYRDDIALYFISSNYPFSAHFLSMKVERLKKVNNIRLVYENPYE